ncbi:hypothetical protein OKW21_002673 [Catalinimonas alkaloidigena]|uniref:hypothetical protein n=1 Tax=Catalinimonas alkaloidigena TaxID=1075417 RepID=UPI0024057CD3|nr:hypothetical protein [Catalinimonas alkaloidigena]MDF9797410.1 hypothetical protein [Catalinimonas alkaloidigena]
MTRISLLLGLILLSWAAQAQGIGEYLGDESVLYAETKQINQFFRRFNGEEDQEGNRYYTGDKNFQEPKLRDKYLKMLFDNQNPSLSNTLKSEFIDKVNSKSDPVILDFHGGEWFAEVNARFTYNGREENAILFLRLQEEKVGSKWIITRAYFAPFAKLFSSDTTGGVEFLHPMSHELDFMNLRKVFQDNKEKVDQFTARGYQPDYLSIMLYEIKNSNLRFKTVSNVKFHFFQVDGWYFQLSKFNRPGYNRGWLISDLVKVSPKERGILTKYIYYEK